MYCHDCDELFEVLILVLLEDALRQVRLGEDLLH